MRNLLVVALTAALAACAVGPDYVRPEAPVPTQFARIESGLNPDQQPELQFWTQLGDPLLDKLIGAALAANLDLRAAAARLSQARAARRESRFDLFPTVSTSAAKEKSRRAADEAPGVAQDQRDADLYEGQFDAFWELDLWGRVRRRVEASRAVADAVAADFRAAQVSVVAEVARTYVELRGLQERLAVARRNADNQGDTLKQVDIRLDAGRGTGFDSARARAQRFTTLARIPALEAAIAAAEHRLAVLVGKQPSALMAELDAIAPIPAVPAEVAVGVPGELLKRRPDVQAAERRLAAATARIGVATADFFPQISFSGYFGSRASSSGDLFERMSESYGFGPQLSWPALDLGRTRARQSQARSAAEASLAQYQQAVLLAAEETENALIGLSRAQRELQALTEAAAASKEAADLARVRFDGGMSDFLQVLEAQRTELDAEDALTSSRTRTATALIALYKALAGGWPASPPTAAAAVAAP